MDILSMCRICLVRDMPLRIIHNTSLQDMYERLTSIPFETKSRRPLYVCYICCAKLSNCLRLQRRCLQSEEMFTQMLHNNMPQHPVQKTNRFKIVHPFINISIPPHAPNNSANYHNIKKEPLDVLQEVQLKDEGTEYNAEEEGYISTKDFLNLLKNENCVDEFEASDNSIQAIQSKKVLAPTNHCLEGNIEIENDILTSEIQNNSLSENRNLINLGIKSGSSNSCHTTVLKDNVDQKKAETMGLEEDDDKTNLTTPKTSLHIALAENQQSESRKFKTTKKKKKHYPGEYKCDICELSFTFKTNLKRHLTIHTGRRIKPYKCDVCDKRYIRSYDLEQHKRVHTGEKPYKCTLCGKDFTRKCYLRQHNLVHYTEKRHKCNICDKYFTRKGNLIEHFRVHTGEKPYKCDVCERLFSQRSSLATHVCIKQT